MARKEVNSFSELPVVRFGEEEGDTFGPGDEFEGYYKGVKEATTKYGAKKVYTFQTASGDVQVWGSANLNQKLEQVQLGSLTTIIYKGEQKSKERGRNPTKIFQVFSDDEDTIKVNVPRVSFQDEPQVEDDEPQLDDDEPADEETEVQARRQPTTTRTTPPISKASPASKAAVTSKLDALMKKKPA